MSQPFSFFLALRYLKPKRTFVSVITVLSVLGVALGICCLIVVIAVMTGFDRELRQRIVGFEPHLTVTVPGEPLKNWEALETRLKNDVRGVEAASPFILGPVLLQFQDEFISAMMRGVKPNGELELVDLRKFILPGGRYELDGEKCIMGAELAASLHILVGDKVQLHGPGNLKKLARQVQDLKEKNPDAKVSDLDEVTRPTELEVVGLFKTGRYDYDLAYVFVRLATAQELYNFEDAVHGIAVRTRDADWAVKFKPELAAQLGPEFSVQSWVDSNQKRLDAVAHERVMMMFVLMFIIIVAAFSISNTLITVIVQKKREIGLLKALGASPAKVVGIFLGQGFIVGLLGNAVGLLLGWAVLSWRNEIRGWLASSFHIDIFDPSIYELTGIPSAIAAQDVVTICAVSMGICVLAAYIPARFAAKLDPVKALREE